jgi:hypothetical protein
MALALTAAACSQDTYLKESPEQVKRDQAAADAYNESTSTTAPPDAPPTTEMGGDFFGSLRTGR